MTSWLFVPALLGGGALVYVHWRGRRPIWVFLSLVFLYLGAVRGLLEERVLEERERTAQELSGDYAEVSGRISSIEETDNGWRISMGDCRVRRNWEEDREEGDGEKVPGVMVSLRDGVEGTDMEEVLGLGQLVSVKGEIELFSEARNPGEFDFKAYYQSLGLDFRIYGDEVFLLDERRDPVLDGLRRVKLWGEEILYRLTLEEEAGIFAAAVMGDKSGIPKEINVLYQKNGIAHLLAISGMHMSVIGLFLYRILRRLGLGYGGAGLGGSVLVILYGILTGGSPSVERAVIMMVVAFFAFYLGRTYDLMSSAAFALLLLGLRSPLFLTQGGVQLSFGAVFAIGGVRPVLEEWVGKGRPLAGAVSTAVAIQMVTLPVVLYHFYQVPLYGMFLNFLAIPLMDGVIYSVFGVIFLGSFSDRLGIWAAGAGHYILVLYEFLCRKIACLPYYNLTFGRPGAWRIAAYLMGLAGVMGVLWILKGRRKGEGGGEEPASGWDLSHLKRLLFVFAMCGFCLLFFTPAPVKGLEVLFLDVGQGDGILVRTGRTAVLVDGGSSSKKTLGEYTLEPCLKSLGLWKIQYAFVSHGDLDHISGISYLLEYSRDIQIETLLLPCQGKEDEQLQRLAGLAEKRGTKVVYLAAGDQLWAEEVAITCLYPGPADIPKNANEESEVLKMDYGDCHILFTGDIGEKEEQLLLNRSGDRVLSEINVLKAAHHGSKYSTGEEFLNAITPRWTVISYGEGNSYGHPHREVLERLAGYGTEILKTGESGAIRLKTDGKTISFSSFVDGGHFSRYND